MPVGLGTGEGRKKDRDKPLLLTQTFCFALLSAGIRYSGDADVFSLQLHCSETRLCSSYKQLKIPDLDGPKSCRTGVGHLRLHLTG